MKVRKKPVVVDAIEYTGKNVVDILSWADGWDLSDTVSYPYYLEAEDQLMIHTLEGQMKANPGDWIIRGPKGEFYPCKPDIFQITYDILE